MCVVCSLCASACPCVVVVCMFGCLVQSMCVWLIVRLRVSVYVFVRAVVVCC